MGMAAAQVVVGDSACPTATEVAAHLENIGGLAPGRSARITRVENALTIKLIADPAQLVGERTFEVAGESCSDLAEAAAVILAALQSESASKESEVSFPRESTQRKPSLPSSRRSLTYDLGAAFVADFAGSAFAPGGEIEASIGRGHWLGRIALSGSAARSLALGTGRVDWFRVSPSLGPELRFLWKHVLLDVHVDLQLAALHVSGAHFGTNLQKFQFDPGLGAGARLGIRAGPFVPFVGVAVVGWFLSQESSASGPSPATVTVPQFDLLLLAGIGVGKFR